jgi:hypothetical protein
MKAVIFDSGSLINLSMNGLLYLLKDLKKSFNGKFLITQEVKFETIDKPIGIERFELGALEIKNLLDSGILEMPEKIGIDTKTLEEETNSFMDKTNHFIQARGKWVNIVSKAEMSCLALSAELTRNGTENIIAIDERTTRILCEDPYSLERIMSEKLHQKVEVIAKDFSIFNKFKFIRSTEIVFVAYKKDLVPLKGNKVLEALLYATKYKGSSVTFEEINILKRM